MKTEKSRERKTTWVIVIGIFILLVLAAGFLFRKTSNSKKDMDKTADKTADEVPEELEEYMTKNLFPGFSGEEAGETIDGSLSNSEILFEYAGSYEGTFYEDGNQKDTKNVFSLILTNTAEQTLEVMQLRIEDEDGESYQFQVSCLPSGGTVLVQELEGKAFQKGASYRIVRDTFGFLDQDQGLAALETREEDGKIFVTNTSASQMGPIQVIYKNWGGAHAYRGGIAYRIQLDSIKPGETLEVSAVHYQEGESKITGMKQTVKE